MQLRYNFRINPTPGQRTALARTFGCARTVYNDALRVRETARTEGVPFPKSGDLSKQLITQAKKTPERAWLSNAPVGVLQQSLRDLDTAYRNFFDSLSGKRKGARIGAPRSGTTGRSPVTPGPTGGRSPAPDGCACRRSAMSRSAGPGNFPATPAR
jgi:putative transposase